MKTAKEIRAEIESLDLLIDKSIEDYKRGIIPEEVLTANKIRLTSVKNALLWVLK